MMYEAICTTSGSRIVWFAKKPRLKTWAKGMLMDIALMKDSDTIWYFFIGDMVDIFMTTPSYSDYHIAVVRDVQNDYGVGEVLPDQMPVIADASLTSQMMFDEMYKRLSKIVKSREHVEQPLRRVRL